MTLSVCANIICSKRQGLKDSQNVVNQTHMSALVIILLLGIFHPVVNSFNVF